MISASKDLTSAIKDQTNEFAKLRVAIEQLTKERLERDRQEYPRERQEKDRQDSRGNDRRKIVKITRGNDRKKTDRTDMKTFTFLQDESDRVVHSARFT